MSTKTCPNCNEINPGNSPFCAACGTSLSAVQETQTGEITGQATPMPGESEPATLDEPLLDTFTIYEPKAFKKGPAWTVNLTPTHAAFISQETGKRIVVLKEKAITDISFPKVGGNLFTGMSEGTVAVVGGVSLNFGANKSRFEKWLPPRPVADMQKDLRGWGIGMIFVGVISFLFPSILDPVWGGVIIVLGILNLLIKHRAMFIVNGLALMAVGILNIMSTCASLSASTNISAGWVVFGIMQFFWGVQELTKFSKYARTR